MTSARSFPICASIALLLLVAAPARAATPATLPVDLGDGVSLALVLIPKGTFTQGSPATEKGRSADEAAHKVTLSADFYLGQYPVTYGQFARFVAATGYRTEAEKGSSGGSGFDGKALVQRKEFTWRSPGFPQTSAHPVTLVTYDDARAFTAWLTRLSGRAFDLPIEAQWEYAYRAGSAAPYHGADSEQGALALGWFKENALGGTHPVGQKSPNGFGLFDMGGNVNEWCRDWYAPYRQDLPVDPEATAPDASDTPRRVLRGGSWFKEARHGRAAARYRNTPGSRNADNGFRVTASATATSAPSPPPSPLPRTPAAPLVTRSPARSDTATGIGMLGVLGGGCMGTIALAGLLLGLSLRRNAKACVSGPSAARQISFRLGADGFWIQAPRHLRGATLQYRYRSPASNPADLQKGWVVLEPNQAGQFVYTGYQPLGVEVLDVVMPHPPGGEHRPSAQARSSAPSISSAGVSGPVHSYAALERPSDPPPFRGFPSAY